MIRILQVARRLKGHPCNIHPLKWIKMIDRCWPGTMQRWIHCDHSPPENEKYAVVIIHAINLGNRTHLPQKFRKACPGALIVGLSYNHMWWPRDQAILKAYQQCDLVFGRMPPDKPDISVALPQWRTMGQLVDEKLFTYSPEYARPIDIVVPRGYNRRDVYWPVETEEALDSIRVFQCARNVVRPRGELDEHGMADLYKQAKVVVSLREDAGVGFSTVEGALCGCVLVVSNSAGPKSEFIDPPGQAFACLTARSADSIQSSILTGLNMSMHQRLQWAERNVRHFQKYTIGRQGPAIVKEIQACLTA